VDEDAVLGAENSLIAELKEHATRDEAAPKFGAKLPFCTCEFDSVLAPAQ
jgi:hypothetical protein